jgi:hypothetical protein
MVYHKNVIIIRFPNYYNKKCVLKVTAFIYFDRNMKEYRSTNKQFKNFGFL